MNAKESIIDLLTAIFPVQRAKAKLHSSLDASRRSCVAIG